MHRRHLALAALLVCALLVLAAPAAQAAPSLAWAACGEAPGVQCATLAVPASYGDDAGDGTFALHVARSPATDPAHRIGSLFINFGGPGGPVADAIEAQGAELFPALNARFDIVGFDPRGVGQSEPAIDCKVNQETEGLYARPFPTPETLDRDALVARGKAYGDRCRQLNGDVLSTASTANTARDMDLLRSALGEERITFLGFSWATTLGSTYAALFPDRYRAMVLDGAVDVDAYLNDPLEDLGTQTAGIERALSRFMQACAADQAACAGFGGSDPMLAYDALLDRLDAAPIPAEDGRSVDGDVARAGTVIALYGKENWSLLAVALAQAQAGDGTLLRLLADAFYGRADDGSYDPIGDAYFTLTAVEQAWPSGTGVHIAAGRHAWQRYEHAWWNAGYLMPYAFLGVRAEGVFRGPFTLPERAVTPLVVGTRYDPATPYRDARALVRELGNAELLTMDGDGHTAYGGKSACIDAAVERYLIEAALPPAGTRCAQDTPFAPLAPAEAPAAAGAAAEVEVLRR